MTNKVELLTSEERVVLPMVISRRSRFKNMIKSSVINYDRLFSNCLMIQGRAGTGKTTLCETFLEQLAADSLIAGVKRIPGHVTPKSMYHIMKETSTPNKDGLPYVLLLDDVDCLGDEGCLELMKAAFDTKSDTPTNRKVFYMTEDGGTGFKYQGFGIIICNNDFGNRKLSVHQEALLDRVQQMSIDLQPNDMMIFTTHLLEKYLNDNEDNLTDDEVNEVVKLFNTDIRRWMSKDAFKKARVNYSIRLIKKFVDSQRVYGEDWKDFNITYQKLEAACQLSEIEEDTVKDSSEINKVSSNPKVALIKKKNSIDVEPKKNSKGKYIKEDGTEYSLSGQWHIKKKFHPETITVRKSA